jgi:hypothetical protein
LLSQQRPLLRDYLGAPRYEEPDYVLELKALEPPPAWLEELLARSGAARSTLSKFIIASEAVHGRPA